MSQRRVNAPVLLGWPATSLQLENNRIIQPLALARDIIHNRSCQGIAWLGSELWGTARSRQSVVFKTGRSV